MTSIETPFTLMKYCPTTGTHLNLEVNPAWKHYQIFNHYITWK